MMDTNVSPEYVVVKMELSYEEDTAPPFSDALQDVAKAKMLAETHSHSSPDDDLALNVKKDDDKFEHSQCSYSIRDKLARKIRRSLSQCIDEGPTKDIDTGTTGNTGNCHSYFRDEVVGIKVENPNNCTDDLQESHSSSSQSADVDVDVDVKPDVRVKAEVCSTLSPFPAFSQESNQDNRRTRTDCNEPTSSNGSGSGPQVKDAGMEIGRDNNNIITTDNIEIKLEVGGYEYEDSCVEIDVAETQIIGIELQQASTDDFEDTRRHDKETTGETYSDDGGGCHSSEETKIHKKVKLPEHDINIKTKIVHTGGKSYICGVCGKAFGQSSGLHRHMKIHAGDRPHECATCGKTFTQKCHLRTHLRIHEGGVVRKPHECPTCGKAFSRPWELRIHIKNHTGEKPFQCLTCGKAYTSGSTLTKHSIIHTGERPFKCHICGRGFKQKPHLTSHVRIHTGEKPFSCLICGKAFCDQGRLSQHRRVHRAKLKKLKYACVTCEMSFARRTSLQKHCRIHTGEIVNKCFICGKIVANATVLQNHIRTHTGEKPYMCHACGKTFSVKSTLKGHISRIHTTAEMGPRFKCFACGRDFSQKCHLQSHITIHTGEKPYKCSTCKKSFRESSGLRIHARTHKKK